MPVFLLPWNFPQAGRRAWQLMYNRKYHMRKQGGAVR